MVSFLMRLFFYILLNICVWSFHKLKSLRVEQKGPNHTKQQHHISDQAFQVLKHKKYVQFVFILTSQIYVIVNWLLFGQI
jgi:hypothetical protein